MSGASTLTRAEVIAAAEAALVDFAGVDLCVLYGSVARDRPSATSDIDILLVGRHRRIAAAFNERLITQSPTIGRLASVSWLGPVDFLAEQRLRPTFIAHLRDEGHLLGLASGASDPTLCEALSAEVPASAVDAEITRRLAHVLPSSDPRRLDGAGISALGRIYSAAKGVCMAYLVKRGTPEYDWRHAFQSFGQSWPSIRDESALLESLRPFYEASRGTRRIDGLEHRNADLLDEAVQCLKDVAVAARR